MADLGLKVIALLVAVKFSSEQVVNVTLSLPGPREFLNNPEPNLNATLRLSTPIGQLNLTAFFLDPKSFFNNSLVHPNIPECGKLDFPELVSKCGLSTEQFDVTSSDGYITTIFHILGGKKTKPLLLMHGVLDSAKTFVIRQEHSTACNLAKAGQDVWIANCRGNSYGRRHVSLDPNQNPFWDFSFHEMALGDLAAHIDFVLEKTGQKKINAIGHSQGNNLFFVLSALKPEYNDKVNLLIAMAPTPILIHARPTVSTTALMWPAASAFLKGIGAEEIFGEHWAINAMIQQQCTQSYGYDLCAKGFIFPFAGSDPEEIEAEFFKCVMGYFPSGTSRRNFDHHDQIFLRKKFAQFDYGPIINLVKYNNIEPPEYNFKDMKIRVAIIGALNDNISTLQDIELLKAQLPNLVYYYIMERIQFNHLDHVWAKHLETYQIPILIQLLDSYPAN